MNYESIFIERINNIYPNAYNWVEKIDELPLAIGKKILSEILETGCKAQNEANIMLGRRTAKRLPRYWLFDHLEEVALSSIDIDDEWEYRRLIELIQEAEPKLMKKFIELGLSSKGAEIREAAEDYMEKSKRTKLRP